MSRTSTWGKSTTKNSFNAMKAGMIPWGPNYHPTTMMSVKFHKGVWVFYENYSNNDIVTHEGKEYYCKIAGVFGINPSQSEFAWESIS